MSEEQTGIKTPKKRRNSRNAGHTYERDCAKELREIGFPYVVTSRSESKSRDDQKIDLMNKDEGTNGRLPYNIQCKHSCQKVDYVDLLIPRTKTILDKKTGKPKRIVLGMPKVPGVVNVIFHSYTEKTAGKTNFVRKEEFAILTKAEFLAMAVELKELRDLQNQFL